MKKDQIRQEYLASAASYRLLEKTGGKAVLTISVLRFITFTGGLILAYIGFIRNTVTGIIVLLVFTTMFLYLIKLFLKYSERRDFRGNLALLNENEAEALSGNLSAYNNGEIYSDIKHDFSYDVDLFGPSSLFHYLNRTVTGYGRDILASWLSDPYAISGSMAARQEAIKELSSKVKWRQLFMAHGMKTPLEKTEISGLLSWIEEKPVIISSLFKRFLITALPAATIASLFLLITGTLPYEVFALIFLGNLLYIAAGLRRINVIHNALSKKYRFLSSVKVLLNTFENESFTSSVLNDIKLNISGKGNSAAVSVKKLGRLIQAFDTRNNQMVGVVLNGLLLWDYQSIVRLEKWKSDYKAQFPLWLEMVGEIDAFISLGNYSFNNPGFAYPSRSDNSDIFSAKDIGHQLIDEDKRVCNDFSLGKKGTVCIISGANMAGKSTFLRTVAVNFILGMTGAPVCAKDLKFIPCKLFTSMRTTDSLSGNESYFYAELRRLNILKTRIESGEPVFFILDEILKGTNSADKSTGSKLFLKRLIAGNGTGLLATHDTSLGELENENPGVVINKCFEIEIDGENIRFDYKIRDGITQKMNAVFLMKQMGILD